MARKGRPRTVAVALAAVLGVALLAKGPADAAGRYKSVTKTFHNFSPIAFNDNAPATPYPSPLAAGGMRWGKILDADVTLMGLTHTWPHDVNVHLVGPRGQNATIMSDVGGNFDVSNVTLTLDDEAANSMSEAGQLVGGTFKPSNPTEPLDSFPGAPAPSGLVALSTFDRTNPNGIWDLYVVDDGISDAGRFASGWSLTIKARVLR